MPISADKRITSEIGLILKRVYEKIPFPSDKQITMMAGRFKVSEAKLKVLVYKQINTSPLCGSGEF